MPEALHQRILRRLADRPAAEALAVHAFGLMRPKCPLPPYRSAGSLPAPKADIPKGGPVFITSRFRTGSTLLWQAFDRLPGFTAYYEPLNERRWFDPVHRGARVDASHRGVSDYAANFDGLAHLGPLFRDDWTYRNIAMGPRAKDEKLVGYIEALMNAAPARPVLQFNRVDFRLPFLDAHFPAAAIVHLRRNARDVWRSMLKGIENDPKWTLATFGPHCHFYLLPWYRDLMISFPWLRQNGLRAHPYLVHYLVWRLSELFAAEWAHIHLDYDALCTDFDAQMLGLLKALGAESEPTDALTGLMSARPSPYDHRKDEAFYAEQEAAAEELLVRSLP